MQIFPVSGDREFNKEFLNKLINEEDVGQTKDLKFLKELYKILSDTHLIEKIEVLSPYGKFPFKGFNPDISISEQSIWKMNADRSQDVQRKAYLISLDIDLKLRKDFSSKRKAMQDIFLYFFDSEWRIARESIPFNNVVDTTFYTRGYSLNNENKKELIFMRDYEDFRYYLKLIFNTLEGKGRKLMNQQF